MRSRFWIGLVAMSVVLYSAVDRVRRERPEAALRAGRGGRDEPPEPPATEPD